MAVTPIATIKNWFMTGLKPTQAQFWAWLDSYRHKDEKIPVGDIDGLTSVLSPFNNHLNDSNAHATLFAKTKIYAPGQLQVFKRTPNTNESLLEVNDLVVGIVQNAFIKGIYQGSDASLLSSYIILEQIDF
jgi:hypothetical protein